MDLRKDVDTTRSGLIGSKCRLHIIINDTNRSWFSKACIIWCRQVAGGILPGSHWYSWQQWLIPYQLPWWRYQGSCSSCWWRFFLHWWCWSTPSWGKYWESQSQLQWCKHLGQDLYQKEGCKDFFFLSIGCWRSMLLRIGSKPTNFQLMLMRPILWLWVHHKKKNIQIQERYKCSSWWSLLI